MSKLILNEDCNLYAMNGKAVYSSRQVAEEFRKRHDNVLQSYDEMLVTAQKAEDDHEIAALKFQVSSDDNRITLQFMKENFFENRYKDASGKMSREVLMTRNGASVLVFSFTGKKSLNFKVKLMLRFEQMEQFIISLNIAKADYPALTAAIKEYKEDPQPRHFINEANMINRIVLGMDAKKFKELNGIDSKNSIRPYLTAEQIKGIEEIQRADIGLLIARMPYEQRKQILIQHFQRINVKRIAA